MSRILPSDLHCLILSYLPLTKIEDFAPVIPGFTFERLASIKYGLPTRDFKTEYTAVDTRNELIPKRLLDYEEIALHYSHDLGKYGHLITYPRCCCISAIYSGDFNLLKHYLYMLSFPHDNFIDILITLATKLYKHNHNKDYLNIVYYLFCFSRLQQFHVGDDDIDHLINSIIQDYESILSPPTGPDINDGLMRFDVEQIRKHVGEEFPLISHVEINFITQDLLASCNLMYDFVSQHWPPSDNRNAYLTLIDIMLNKNFDLTGLVPGSLAVMEQIACSMCIEQLDKVLKPSNAKDKLPLITSEVIYDANMYYKIIDYYDYNDARIIDSLWIAGAQKIFYSGGTLSILTATIEELKSFIEGKFGPKIRYADIAILCKSLYPSLDIDRLLKPINWNEYQKMKQYGLEPKLKSKIFKSHHWFTDAENLYSILLAKLAKK